MGLFKTIARSANAAVKLPFAMAWDVISLGNMGEGTSTSKVLREHEDRKQVDDLIEAVEALRKLRGDRDA
jgi:hypothetical protein